MKKSGNVSVENDRLVTSIDTHTDYLECMKLPESIRNYIMYEFPFNVESSQLHRYIKMCNEKAVLNWLRSIKRQSASNVYGADYPTEVIK